MPRTRQRFSELFSRKPFVLQLVRALGRGISHRILDSIGNINSYILEQKAELAEDDYYARLLKETASR